jgi:starch synthase
MTVEEKVKVLYVTQEITPYLKESHLGLIGRHLPQGIQERGREIRTFMPRYGLINERRNQLHEVIRLSGMNLVINDTDHPLIIKVASIQTARMQIYFIDNEDYFHRKSVIRDKNDKFFEDNDERMVFYGRGVLETVKKLGWAPSVVHCHGWISSLVPFYVKTSYSENPIFSEAKIIVSLYDDAFPEHLSERFPGNTHMEGVTEEQINLFKSNDYVGLMKGVIDLSDAFIMGSPEIHPEVMEYMIQSGKPYLEHQSSEDYIDAYNAFYDVVLTNVPV